MSLVNCGRDVPEEIKGLGHAVAIGIGISNGRMMCNWSWVTILFILLVLLKWYVMVGGCDWCQKLFE